MPRYRDKITPKQKAFVREYVKNKGNGTTAVLRTYNTKDLPTARNISSKNLMKPVVQEELNKILEKENLKLDKIVDNIGNIAVEQPTKGYSGSEILEANKTLLKLHGVLTDKKQITSYSVNMLYNDMSEHELLELRKNKLNDINNILEGEEIS